MADASPDLAIRIPAPAQGPRRRGGRHLKVVHASGRRRSAALPVVMCAGVVIVFMFAVAAMHAMLIDGQIQLDEMRDEVASETATVERLRLEVAELEAPERILAVAKDRLGMQEPTDIGYVLPEEAVGADAELLRVPPATVPPPPTTAPPVVTVPADTGAKTESGVDDAVAAALASAGVAPTPTTADTPTSPTGGTSSGERAPTTTTVGADG